MTDTITAVASLIPQRIQRKRAKGWRLPEGAICITRPGPFSNSFRVEDHGRVGAVEMYRQHLCTMSHGPLRDLLGPLVGAQFLACWCALDQPCHGDVLIRALELYEMLQCADG